MDQDFIVIKNISYCQTYHNDARETEPENDIFNKANLDLFLPKQRSRDTLSSELNRGATKHKSDRRSHMTKESLAPVVMFVHGGGWRRGNKQAWMHYISSYDTNLLVSLFLRYLNLYDNVGETLARNGIACAVVSYPLSKLPFPLVLLEIVTSFLFSLVFFCFVVSVLVLCVTCSTAYSTYLSMQTLNSLFPENWRTLSKSSFLWLFLASSQHFTWLFVFVYRRNYGFTTTLFVVPGIVLELIKQGLSQVILSTETVVLLWSTVTVVLIQGILIYEQIYRVPEVRHPQHVQAVARAVGWLKQYGVSSRMYDAQQIYLMGHSAGGHLVTLVTLNEQYLQMERCSIQDIKGVISISGVYDLHRLSSGSGVLGRLYVEPAFGSCSQTIASASPIHYLTKSTWSKETFHHIPYLIFSAELDFSLLDDAKYFVEKLMRNGISHIYKVKYGANHFNIISNFGCKNSIHSDCIEFIHDTINKNKN